VLKRFSACAEVVLIDRFLPTFDVVERHAIVVRADAARAYLALKEADLAGPWLVRALFLLRALGSRRRIPGGPRGRLTMDDLVPAGFFVLAEEDASLGAPPAGAPTRGAPAPERKIALGTVGRFWSLRPEPRPLVSAATFAEFEEAGWAKAVVSFSVEPLGDSRSRIRTETRVRATDAASRRRFLRYWRLVGPFSALIRWLWLREFKAIAERAA
jgi:hypothetical protein